MSRLKTREEQVDDGDGVEGALAPGMLDVAADGDDLGPVELPGRSVPDLAKDADESMVHGCLLPGDPDKLLTAGGEIMFKPLSGQDLGNLLALCHSGRSEFLGNDGFLRLQR